MAIVSSALNIFSSGNPKINYTELLAIIVGSGFSLLLLSGKSDAILEQIPSAYGGLRQDVVVNENQRDRVFASNQLAKQARTYVFAFYIQLFALALAASVTFTKAFANDFSLKAKIALFLVNFVIYTIQTMVSVNDIAALTDIISACREHQFSVIQDNNATSTASIQSESITTSDSASIANDNIPVQNSNRRYSTLQIFTDISSTLGTLFSNPAQVQDEGQHNNPTTGLNNAT